ncbi:carbohydrate ABC transporter substrate-binding protein (CUT1 family) [Knoellia remsis]|uniref:Carbohydrate ABC transporter substrate-binding protein (CUT1 family) n=1 Tax=Knoellia remsis TaxID=407159 RepID=A0A2T0U9V7_9MICO|nr:extracellular solute-binding protein [Knoellia remsis]PRY54694.1 carbohydrate ABC transporter substrate-binding protein (CUT1 family) [Knoellia remsis]
MSAPRARFTLVPLALSGALLVSACAGVGGGAGNDDSGGDAGGGGALSGTPSGSLKIMGFGGEDEVGQSRVKAFTSAYPEVKVAQNKGEFDAQQFLTAVSSGNPPDLVYMDRNLIGTYAAKEVVQPLTDCVEGQDIDTGQYRPAAMRSVTYDDVVYGIPEFYIVQTNLIDAKSLKAAGVDPKAIQTQDWDALDRTATQLFEKSGTKIGRVGYDPKLPDSFPLWALINGAELVKEDGSPNLNDPKAVEALAYATSLVEKQGGWTSFKAFRDSFDIFGDSNPLTKGTITAFPMENWYVNVLRDSIPAGLQLTATPITDREGETVSTLGGSTWAIPKGAKNPTAACAWMKTMTSTETWLKAAEARMAKVKEDKSFFTGLFTANTAADEQIREKYLTAAPDAGFDTAINAFYDTLDKATALNPSPAGAEIDAAWKSAVARTLGGQDAKASLDQAQKEATTAFEKARRG